MFRKEICSQILVVHVLACCAQTFACQSHGYAESSLFARLCNGVEFEDYISCTIEGVKLAVKSGLTCGIYRIHGQFNLPSSQTVCGILVASDAVLLIRDRPASASPGPGCMQHSLNQW